MATLNLRLRPVVPTDEPLLVELYASTRAAELALVSWDEAQRLAFVRMQLAGQTSYYQSEYPAAEHSLVLCDEIASGRLYVDRRPLEIRILDLIILPVPQAEAIGTQLVTALQTEAAAAQLPLTIQLEPFNSTLPLFERLGFVPLSQTHSHTLYEWRSPIQPRD